jgi:hypothetical protein
VQQPVSKEREPDQGLRLIQPVHLSSTHPANAG